MVTAVYVHIPFCDYKCTFCDFATYVGQHRLISPYVDALNAELLQYEPELRAASIASIFLGGGTPTVLPPEMIGALLRTIDRRSPQDREAEVTAESNPDTLTPQYLRALRESGVNRLSVGVQSLNDHVLAALNRRHTARQALDSLRDARNAGFSSINADLMFGLPGQTFADWKETLAQLLVTEPDHLSLYGLIVEKGALLQHQLQRGLVLLPEDDEAARMYEHACQTLGEAGYVHYEISNWARPGHQSRHNLVYWQHDRYLGVGLSAHSYLDDRRFSNVRGLQHYLARLRQNRSPVLHSETITPERARSDAAIVGLRMTSGLDVQAFDARFGGSLIADHRQALKRLGALGLIALVAGRLRLTQNGYLLANQVWQEFL